jgi:hypothetical protein
MLSYARFFKQCAFALLVAMTLGAFNGCLYRNVEKTETTEKSDTEHHDHD